MKTILSILKKHKKGAALVEYVILFAAILIPTGAVVVELTRTTDDLYEVPGSILFSSTPTVEVPPSDPTGGPGGTPDNTPSGPVTPTGGGSWSGGAGGGGYSGEPVVYCAPVGTRWTGSTYEAPGVKFNVSPSPKHHAYPIWSPTFGSEPKTTTISVNVPYYQYWYPEYKGEHMYFFIYYDYWGDEIEIPPNSIQPPGSTCTSP